MQRQKQLSAHLQSIRCRLIYQVTRKGIFCATYRLTKLTMHRGEVALGSNQADGSVNLPPHLAFPTPPCPQACIHPTQRLSQGLASHSIAT